MSTKKFTCKVNKANAQNNSIRCTIPKDIVNALDIVEGDTIKWIIEENNENTIVTVEKLIL